VIYTGSPGLLR